MKSSRIENLSGAKLTHKVTESPHYNFLKTITAIDRKRFWYKKYLRPVGKTAPDDTGYVDLISVEDGYLGPALKLHPEAAAFLFFINGCAKNLLFFILMQRVKEETGLYYFNPMVIDIFKKYAEQLFQTKYTTSTIKQAHRDLVDRKITCNVKRWEYFLNPLIAGSKNESNRRDLIKKYSNLLKEKRKNAFLDLYPVYSNTQL